MTDCRHALVAAVVATTGIAALAGCGKSGPEKYDVTGRVLYGEAAVQTGDIIFEPKDGIANLESMTRAEIKDGQYKTKLVGGTHIVTIRDYTGDREMDPENFKKLERVLRKQYRGEVPYPPLDQVKDGTLTLDIEIPEKFR